VDIQSLLGAEADSLLNHEAKGIPRRTSTSRAPTTSIASCRSAPLAPRCCATCRRSSTTAPPVAPAYVSILPVDQGIEHSAAA